MASNRQMASWRAAAVAQDSNVMNLSPYEELKNADTYLLKKMKVSLVCRELKFLFVHVL